MGMDNLGKCGHPWSPAFSAPPRGTGALHSGLLFLSMSNPARSMDRKRSRPCDRHVSFGDGRNKPNPGIGCFGVTVGLTSDSEATRRTNPHSPPFPPLTGPLRLAKRAREADRNAALAVTG